MACEAVCAELLSRKLITDAQFGDIVNNTGELGFIESLIEKGYISFDSLAQVIKQVFLIDYTYLADEEIDPRLKQSMTHSISAEHQMIPLRKTGGIVLLAMSNPFRFGALEEAQHAFGCACKAVFASPSDVRYQINKIYGRESMAGIAEQFADEDTPRARAARGTDELIVSPAGRIVKTLIDAAIMQNASDIHIEPYEDTLRVRLRIDGRLTEYRSMELSLTRPIISIIKIMGSMDTYIGMTPQNGHTVYETHDSNTGKIDLRFSTVPTIHGEKAVIRLLYGVRGLYTKDRLGFFKDDLEKISLLFRNSHGAILVTGPTGSGKSTTLYSFLAELNSQDVNITTIEDPVENAVFGVNQINVNPKTGLDFAGILRSVLRQDPDVIMIGEIRDAETAEISIRAALTGHIVLATLHTNDAVSAILRLIDMGADRFAVAHSVRGIISQRLVRRICVHCKIEKVIDVEDAEILDVPIGMTVYEGLGCSRCNYSGYIGRFAVYEYFVMDAKLRTLIDERASFEKLSEYLLETGMETLKENTLKNLKLGNTTVSEMYRVVF